MHSPSKWGTAQDWSDNFSLNDSFNFEVKRVFTFLMCRFCIISAVRTCYALEYPKI